MLVNYYLLKSPFIFGQGFSLAGFRSSRGSKNSESKSEIELKFKDSSLAVFLPNKITLLPLGTYSSFHFYKNFVLFTISKNKLFLSFFVHLFNILTGYCKKFRSRFTLYGLRIRIEKIFRKGIILKLNLAHKVKWFSSFFKFKKLRKVKNSFVVFNRNIDLHNIFLYALRRFKSPDVYRGNGIKFYKEKLIFKKRKQFGVI